MARPREPHPADLMALYLDYIEARYSLETHQAYTTDLQQFRDFYQAEIGPTRKREIGPRLLDQYLIHLRHRGLAPATIERRLQALKGFFAWTLKREYLRANPFLFWEIPRAKETLPRALTPEEDHRLLRMLMPWPRTAFARMAAMAIRLGRFAGLRVGECNTLEWPDVELVKGVLLIRESKGEESRVVPMPPAGLLAPMRAWWIDQDEPSRGFVLTGLYGQPLPPKSLSRTVKRWYGVARIPDASFHTLRATYATRLSEHGVPLPEIQRLLGHKDPRTTMRYVAVSDERKRAAVEKLDQDLPKT